VVLLLGFSKKGVSHELHYLPCWPGRRYLSGFKISWPGVKAWEKSAMPGNVLENAGSFSGARAERHQEIRQTQRSAIRRALSL
jgi:hypothetical protein